MEEEEEEEGMTNPKGEKHPVERALLRRACRMNRRQVLTQTAAAGLGAWVISCSSQPVGKKSWGASGSARDRVGVKEVTIKDIEQNVVFYDKNMYSAHPNRGGLWNFGDGEIVVAHLVNTECPYDGPQWVNHNYKMPTTGVMAHRSFDNGKTWPAKESKKWIWNNARTEEELIEWATPVPKEQRAKIDMSAPDSIMHLGHSHYVNSLTVAKPFRGLCIRSADRGRTWESKPTVITGAGGKDEAFLIANLGHVQFDNGVLGIVGLTYAGKRRYTMFYTSYDNGLSWEYLSTIASIEMGTGGDIGGRYTYAGVHRLPDSRLMCSMHKVPGNQPCVSFSEDSGQTWSPPQFIIGPESFMDIHGEPHEDPIGDFQPSNWREVQRYRSPAALVLRDGRIVVVFARRESFVAGGNGIHGVLSDDGGETWSKEFLIWGDGYSNDLGYPCLTELEDGQIFTAYYATVKEHERPIDFYRCVRHIRSTTFRL